MQHLQKCVYFIVILVPADFCISEMNVACLHSAAIRFKCSLASNQNLYACLFVSSVNQAV